MLHHLTADFWEKYSITLIIISVAILFLLLLVFIARKKYPKVIYILFTVYKF